jgi:hypothetical protein
MPTTYEPIATTTLGSAQSSVTFSSISGTYTDLVLIVSGTVSTANNPSLQFNSDTGSNYSWTYLSGNGSSAASGRSSNTTSILTGGFGTSTIANAIYQIQNYSNTTTNKTVINRHNRSDDSVTAWVGLWRNTAAITSLVLGAGGGNWNTGSTFTLYGIKAA